MWELRQETIKEFTIDPTSFGLTSHPLSKVAGGTPLENSQILTALLDNQLSIDDPIENFVIMNTAALLWVAGKVEGLLEGVEMARESIRTGGAREALNSFREESLKVVANLSSVWSIIALDRS